MTRRALQIHSQSAIKAMRVAVREVLREHRVRQLPVFVLRNGRVKAVDAASGASCLKTAR